MLDESNKEREVDFDTLTASPIQLVVLQKENSCLQGWAMLRY